MDDQSETKRQFLEEHIFRRLTNLNDGFDSKNIHYFTEAEFRIVLERIEKMHCGIYGIEPWKNGHYYATSGFEDYTDDPRDPQWYNRAFEEFIATGEALCYAASYFVPGIEL